MIGKVVEKHEATIQINYWKGSWNKKWVPWLIGNKQPWADVLPKECIYLTSFELTTDSKLQAGTKQKIREFLNTNK